MASPSNPDNRSPQELRGEASSLQSGIRSRQAQALAQVGFLDLDLPSGQVSLSEEAQRILGLAPQEVPGLRGLLKLVVHPEDQALVKAAATRALLGEGLFDLDHRIIQPGGTCRWVHSQATVDMDAEGRPVAILGTIQDITFRKAVEETHAFLANALWDAEGGGDFFHALARYLAKALPMDYICIDRLCGDELSAETLAVWFDGRFEDNVTYTLKDTPCGEVVGRTVCSFPARVCELFPQDEVLRDMGAESYLGATLWSSLGRPIGLIAAIGRRPVESPRMGEAILALVAVRAAGELERRGAEAARRLSETQMEEAFEASPIGMALVSLDGHFLKVNPILCAMVGWDEQELLATGFKAITHPQDLSSNLELVREVLEGKRKSYQIEKRYLHRNGSEVWVQINGSLVRDVEGRPQHFVSQILDITERVRADHQRSLTVDILEVLNREEDPTRAASLILQVIQREMGVAAAAIRLAAEGDFNYAAHSGFPVDFIQAETCLRARNREGIPLSGPDGEPLYECTCGLVLSGKIDPTNPLFTPGGSAWTNDALPFLDVPLDQDPRLHPRNRCIHSGYRSVALIPIRSGERIVGLLQLNDPRPNCFSAEMIAFLEGISASIGLALARKQTHERLEESLRHLRLAHEAAQAGSWEWDLRTGQNFWSEGLYRLFGLVPSSVEPSFQVWLDLVHPDDRAHMEQVARGAMAAHAELNFEWRVCRPDGSVRWLMSRASPVLDDHGRPVRHLGIAVDITERKEVENQLRRSEEGHRLLLEHIHDVVFVLDPQGRFTYLSPSWTRLLGHPLQAALQHPFQAFVHPEDVPACEALLAAALGGLEPLPEVDYRCLHGDGSWRWLNATVSALKDSEGRMVGLQGSARDITEWKRSEADLLRERDLIDAIFNSIPGRVYLYDDQGRLVKWNRRHEAMTGYSAAELSGMSLLDWYRGDPVSQETILAGVQTTLTTGFGDAEALLQVKDGPPIPMYFTAAPVSIDGKTYFTGIGIDITERRRGEERQQVLSAQLHQSQKMESLGSLAGGVAHDINNVLAAILGLASGHRERLPDTDPLARALDTITKACLRGRDVVRSLLYFARKDLGTTGPVDLNALVLEIVPLLDRASLKRVQVSADLEPTLEPFQGDAGSLSHAIMNLCVNALDAMPDGGDLAIRTRHRVGGGYDLCVQDTGMGMAEEVRLRACEPFFTTKPVGKGTGLGLSMAYGVMQAHGGRMSLASEPGRGTEVILHFPPPPEAPALQTRKAPMAAEAPSAPLRILLVDDDELIRESLAPMLEELLGHRVYTAASGLEALDKLAAGLEVDLIILDMNMPGLDGAHTLERLLERSPRQAVLMATGNSEMAIADALAGHPNVAGIQKPFSATELDRAFRDLRRSIASELEPG